MNNKTTLSDEDVSTALYYVAKALYKINTSKATDEFTLRAALEIANEFYLPNSIEAKAFLKAAGFTFLGSNKGPARKPS